MHMEGRDLDSVCVWRAAAGNKCLFPSAQEETLALSRKDTEREKEAPILRYASIH